MSETKERELSPCAHCGSDNVKIRKGTCYDKMHRDWYTYYQVECVDCDIQTCKYTTESEAIAAWNRRAAPAAEWTTEVPSEDGLYWVATYGRVMPARIHFAFETKDWQIDISGSFSLLDMFCKSHPNALWLQPDVPALPGKGGSE